MFFSLSKINLFIVIYGTFCCGWGLKIQRGPKWGFNTVGPPELLESETFSLVKKIHNEIFITTALYDNSELWLKALLILSSSGIM